MKFWAGPGKNPPLPAGCHTYARTIGNVRPGLHLRHAKQNGGPQCSLLTPWSKKKQRKEKPSSTMETD
ncbi:hypothetical protein Golax_005851 [Gossypium laxum]|uniref:Uncharacterized protein n=1 Tax=Gossypium laxum TaxID=34288 RepID=A0A7J9A262_9ROSI|nr:hypothetical protein [Gossypium laxum]